VATPDYVHLEMAEAAFANQKHVMMEKPLARTVDECQRMIDAQRAAGTKLMTAHVARFYSHFQKIKGIPGRPYIGSKHWP
ncbi:MAG: Gfo/Idh/MocA family protein, partial [Spirochaetia bacterium]